MTTSSADEQQCRSAKTRRSQRHLLSIYFLFDTRNLGTHGYLTEVIVCGYLIP